MMLLAAGGSWMGDAGEPVFPFSKVRQAVLHGKIKQNELVVEPTHPKKYAQVKLDPSSPRFRGEFFVKKMKPLTRKYVPGTPNNQFLLADSKSFNKKLVGGFNPSKKYESKWESSPSFGVKIKKCI